MAQTAEVTERTRSVSDPSSPDYDAQSPYYDVTADSSSEFYVGPLAGTSPSGDEIRAEVTREVDQENAGHTSWLSKLLDPILRDHNIQSRYEDRIEQRRQHLADGLDIRQNGGPPSTVWANATHEQMNDAISQNADSATVAAASEEWIVVGNQLAEHQRNLAEAITDSTSNWQGAGGDAARQHLASVGKWLGTTAQGATLTGHQQQLQSQALNETQKRMGANPPVAFSVQDANARLQTITDPVQYAQAAGQEMQVYKEQQAAREQAARLMTDFDNTVGGAVATPAFPAPPKLSGATAAQSLRSPTGGGGAGGGGAAGSLPDGSLPNGSLPNGGLPGGSQEGQSMSARTDGVPALDAAAAAGGGAPGGYGAPGDVGGAGAGAGGFGGGAGGGFDPAQMPTLDSSSGGGGSAFSGAGGLPSGGYSGGGIPGGGQGGIPQLDDSTTAAGFSPPSTSPAVGVGGAPGLNVPSYGDGTTRGGSALSGTGAFPTGATGGFTPGGLPTIGRDGGVNGSSIGSRLSGLGPIEQSGIKGAGLGGTGGLPGGGKGGIGSLGGAGGGGGGSVGGAGAGGNLAAGSSSGAAGAAAEAAAARGAAGGVAGKGTTGSPMGGMGHGAGKGGDEDKEHKLADYLEPDDPSIFAPDQVVAPPVIGDWTNTDWK
ncbi:MAG: hypothetical protein QOI21_5882 [Actinomycetota bacterium]|nr:hypothetical protein [Actinomycetota bacterium]